MHKETDNAHKGPEQKKDLFEYEDLEETLVTDLKYKINGLIWEYGSPSLTLSEAEMRACKILNIIRKKPSPEDVDKESING